MRFLPNSRALAFGALVGGILVAPWNAPGHAQTGSFQPGANPVSNQPWDEAVITVGTAFPVTRAIYNGNATACNITVTTNGGHSIQHQNVQPGEYLLGQFTLVSASTCSAGVLIAEF
jgi:hypothetical protein